ncbi:MAG: energy transducer TonB, partial [Deltaproteobacteria bacterium]|nr:energy transducer TonB [Deltaproteobacteria bacterium]
PDAAAGNGTGSGAGSGSGSGPGTGSGSGGGTGSGAGRDIGAGGGPDLRAFCVDCPEPRYPRQAVLRGWQGKVWIELALNPDGEVASAAVARSSGFPLLDDAAVQVARQSRFRIADRRSGLLAYTFRLTASR